MKIQELLPHIPGLSNAELEILFNHIEDERLRRGLIFSSPLSSFYLGTLMENTLQDLLDPNISVDDFSMAAGHTAAVRANLSYNDLFTTQEKTDPNFQNTPDTPTYREAVECVYNTLPKPDWGTPEATRLVESVYRRLVARKDNEEKS